MDGCFTSFNTYKWPVRGKRTAYTVKQSPTQIPPAGTLKSNLYLLLDFDQLLLFIIFDWYVCVRSKKLAPDFRICHMFHMTGQPDKSKPKDFIPVPRINCPKKLSSKRKEKTMSKKSYKKNQWTKGSKLSNIQLSCCLL
jgi:hypothetical protein